MSTPIKTATLSALESARDLFAKDLDALTEEQLMNCPGGKARKPIDFVFESAVINRRLAGRLRRETLPPMSSLVELDENNWVVAPADYNTKEIARADFVASIQEVIDQVKGASEEEMLSDVETSDGLEPYYSVAQFAGVHSLYHDAQLCYVQSLYGDVKMHWGD